MCVYVHMCVCVNFMHSGELPLCVSNRYMYIQTLQQIFVGKDKSDHSTTIKILKSTVILW